MWAYASDASGTVALPTGNLPGGKYQVWVLYNDGYTALGGPADLTVT